MKEIISLAIILSFIINLAFVPHPDTSSYTIYFTLSLLAISPFLMLWRFWLSSRAERQLERRDVIGRGPVSVTDAFELDQAGDAGLSVDLEKGLVEVVEEAHDLDEP